jgi:hypothetical protein
MLGGAHDAVHVVVREAFDAVDAVSVEMADGRARVADADRDEE